MDNLEISVIIPAFNAGRYISESISTVINQTFRSWELIVVDDGSTDNTVQVITPFLEDSRIKLIRQTNKGVSSARNAGISAARGRFIAFLDADDAYLPENLAQKDEILKQSGSVDFVYCDAIRCDENLKEVRVEKGADTDNLFIKVMEWNTETIPALSSNILVKASLMKEKIKFDENLSNCADRYMKIMLSKYAIGQYLPMALIKYRDSPGSMSKKVKLFEHDEKYIIGKIIEDNIIPAGSYRNRVIANIYLILSGSWYRNAHNPWRAVLNGLKSIITYPPVLKVLATKFFSSKSAD